MTAPSLASKQSLYLDAAIVEEMQAEARRLNRSLSWVAQRAWKLSREQIQTQGSQADE